MMRRISLRLERESQWAAMYDARLKRVRVPCQAQAGESVQFGQAMRLDIELGTSGTVVVLRGLVIEEVTEDVPSDAGVVQAGATSDTAPLGMPPREADDGDGAAAEPVPTTFTILEISPIDRDKVSHLRAFLRGALLNLRRRRRVMVRLPVVFRGIDGLVETFSRDISEEGMFVYAQSLLPEKTKLQLQVRFPDGGEAILDAFVVYVVRPEREAQPGMGLRFELATPAASEVLPMQIASVEKALHEGSLADEYY